MYFEFTIDDDDDDDDDDAYPRFLVSSVLYLYYCSYNEIVSEFRIGLVLIMSSA